MSKSKRQLQAKAESDVSETVKNADGEPENPYNRVLQDIAEIFPFYPFRQGQTDARYKITVHRRDKDEYIRLFKKLVNGRLTKKEHKALKQLNYELYWRKNRLTIKELRLIGQTVGSYDMDTIRDFLLRCCYVPLSELNDLSWEDILKRLRALQFTIRRGKELQAAPASEQKKEEMIVLTQNQRKILKYLKGINTAVAQVDIESQTGLSNKTISAELRILKEYNLAAPPKGKARRIVITKRGVDFFNVTATQNFTKTT